MVRETTIKVVTDGIYCGDENEKCPAFEQQGGRKPIYGVCTLGNLFNRNDGIIVVRDSRLEEEKFIRCHDCFITFDEEHLYQDYLKGE